MPYHKAPPLPAVPVQLRVLFKPGLYARKPAWRDLPLADVPALVAAWEPQAFARGEVGLWLAARTETAQGRAYFPWLDVESTESHGDIQANIDAAQGLFLRLSEAGLDAGLVVLLTGRGFRFCWPFAIEPELAPAFLAMLRDSARWPGIDAGPQAGGQPLALAGYRGHRSQGRKGNVHFAMLPEASDLLTLTPEKYAEMVAGPADLTACQTLVGVCQPRSWTPPAWRSVLDEYRRELELRRHVIKIKFPARPEGQRRVSWAAIEDHLAGLGIRVTRELEVEGNPVRLLSECPSCGKKHKARLTGSGRLKCWSTSCQAGEMALDLQGNAFHSGLALAVWAPGLVPTEDITPELHQPLRDAVTVAAARATIRAALAGDAPALLLKIPAGVGKSHAALEHALDVGRDGLVLMTCPTTALAEELAEKGRQMALEAGLDVEVRQYRGRSEETCAQAERCEHVAAKGFSPGLLVCGQCMNRDGCDHFHQLDGLENGIVVAAHAAAPYVLPKIAKHGLREWIIDESPLRDLMRQEVVYEGSLTALKIRLVGHAEQALDKIQATAEQLLSMIPAEGGKQGRLYATTPPGGEWEKTMPLWEAAGITDAEREALSEQLAYFDQHKGEKPGKWQRRLWDERVDLAALRWLWLGLGEKGQGSAYIRCKPHPVAPIKYRSMVNMTPILPDAVRVLALDATGNDAELEHLFSRPFKVLDATVELPPARQVWMRQAMGKWKTGRMLQDQAKTEALFHRAIANLRPQDRKVLLVTHKDAELTLLELARRLDPGREWASTHYWANRGLDCWRDYDACLAFGTPTANRAEVLDLELALFGGDQAARDAWFSSLGPRDLIQAVNRVRPVLAPKTLIVVGREWPAALGAPSFTLDSRRKGSAAEAVETAYQRLLPLAQKYGIMFSELAHVAGVFRAEDKAQAQDWRERVLPLLEDKTLFAKAPTLIKETLIRVGALAGGVFEPIPLDRKGTWPALMSRLADATDLPELAYRPRSAHGGGRAQAAVGTLAAVRRLCAECGLAFDPTLWAGQEEEPLPMPNEPAEAASQSAIVHSVHVHKVTIHRRVFPHKLPPELPVIEKCKTKNHNTKYVDQSFIKMSCKVA